MPLVHSLSADLATRGRTTFQSCYSCRSNGTFAIADANSPGDVAREQPKQPTCDRSRPDPRYCKGLRMPRRHAASRLVIDVLSAPGKPYPSTVPVQPCPKHDEGPTSYARRSRIIGNSGLHVNRAGQILVPVPRLTYALPPRVSYQPARNLPHPCGRNGTTPGPNRICPP